MFATEKLLLTRFCSPTNALKLHVNGISIPCSTQHSLAVVCAAETRGAETVCDIYRLQTADWQIIYRVTYTNIYYIYTYTYAYTYTHAYTYTYIPIPIRSASLANRSSSLANPSASLQVCSLHLWHTGAEMPKLEFDGTMC